VNALLLGSQRPTLLHEPPDAVDWRWSDIAVEWAATVAGYELDEWQQWLVRWSFVRRADGLWAARDVGVEVGRQNGKNIWIEVVELASLLLFGDRLIRHTAQLVDTSHEHFVSLKERIEGTPELMAYMPKRNNNGFVKSHGYESIEFDNGARLQFKARQTSSGRGPRPQKVVFDEALVLDPGRVGSMAPGVSAQKNAQLLFASSPPKADSESLHAMRKRATDPEPGDRLFYAAWNNPPDTDPKDLEALHRVNPSLGYGRLTVTSLEANRRLLSDSEYLREHCGVPEAPLSDRAENPIDLARWALLADGQSLPTPGSERLALDAPLDRSTAVFSVAGVRPDNLLHVSVHTRVVRPANGLLKDAVITAALEAQKKLGTPIILPPSSPAKAWRADLIAAGVELDELSAAEYSEACGAMAAAVDDGALRHRGQPDIDLAVAGLAVRPFGEVDVWSARNSSCEIAAFRAATCALVRVAVVEDKPYDVLSSVF
jgi:hypothetical protein